MADQQDIIPALQRGLAVLERIVTDREGVAFNELLNEFDIPKATLARLLRTLRAGGHIAKNEDTGLYEAGPAMAAFAVRDSIENRLRDLSAMALETLREQTGNTAALVFRRDLEMIFLAKAMHEGSVPMRAVGAISRDFSEGPWAWVFFSWLDTEEQKAARRHMPDPEDFYKSWPARSDFLNEFGFAYDDQAVLSNVRRLAAPIIADDGRPTAALVLGGNPLTIRDEQVNAFGRFLVDTANALAARLGWPRP